ncbi:hypothetical protein RHGRI_016123 [Rhododendron griersonianum]|uniref:EF-hand domain-containing protein n=1 Tax=Rhododendron griersonianum TaxID=479676 RepID=A0AAV6JSB9_9ERIC|nr:hypothetical protein RHGRI_016123 [Rhododendron griersonianum]
MLELVAGMEAAIANEGRELLLSTVAGSTMEVDDEESEMGSMIDPRLFSEMDELFRYLDSDGNGKISSDELQAYFASMGESMPSDEAQKFNKDGDNLLEFTEFVKLMERESEEEDDDIRRAFEMFEVEKGSGCITPRGLQQVLNRLGKEKSGEDYEAMIRAFDLDGNGVLDFYEFNKMMTPRA